MSDTPVYPLWNSNLGDHWASLNLHLCRSAMRGQTVLVHAGDWEPRANEILGTLATFADGGNPRAQLQFTDRQPTEPIDGFSVWATPYFHTKQQWSILGASKTICYHFEGLSAAVDKNPPPGDGAKILHYLRAMFPNHELVKLGSHQSLAQMVNQLANCEFFVGVDSGPSHVAHSVGCPIFLLEYKLPVVTTHRGKAYIHCAGTDDFLDHKVLTWKRYLRDIREC